MNLPNSYAFARMVAQGDLKTVHSGLRRLQRGQWIVCRSDFGLELAQILSDTQEPSESTIDSIWAQHPIANWVRDANTQDHWLWEKLQSLNHDAVGVCQAFLKDHHSKDTLLEIATSIDGKSVAFEFLGDPSEETNRKLDELSEIYQAFIRNSEIYQQIETGCGPGCGTGSGSACGSSPDGKTGCSSCSIAKRCKPAK